MDPGAVLYLEGQRPSAPGVSRLNASLPNAKTRPDLPTQPKVLRGRTAEIYLHSLKWCAEQPPRIDISAEQSVRIDFSCEQPVRIHYSVEQLVRTESVKIVPKPCFFL